MSGHANKTREQLLAELEAAERRIAELESRLGKNAMAASHPAGTIGREACGEEKCPPDCLGDAVRLSEERFKQLLEDVDMVAVQGYDSERRVIFWNTASERLYGYSAEEAQGRLLEDLIIPEHMRDGVIGLVANWVDHDARIPSGELDLRHKDGSLVPVYSSHVMQTNSDGSKEMYCIDIDLSEIKKANTLLLQAKNAAEAASRAKNDFLANMSHEIRTPLNGLIGMLQLLKTTRLDEEQVEFTDMALQSGRRLTALLSDILDIARIEAGKMQVREAPFDLRASVMEVIELFLPESRQAFVQLFHTIDRNLPKLVAGDAIRLQQVLINLIGNAFKFTREGCIIVEAWTLPYCFPGKHQVLFCVADTGCGIPEDRLTELFQPFTQATQGYQREYQGAGLGLSICKRLVTLMGGSMSIDSHHSAGTTIFFSLPFGQVEPAALLERKDEADPETLPGLFVLIAEDDATSGFAAKRHLEAKGCHVTLVGDGLQALAALTENAYDVVLMDVQMPIMDGVEATLLIRRGETGNDNRSVPIIAMTAYALEDDRESFLAAGMDDYISKPLELDTLLDVLARTVARQE